MKIGLFIPNATFDQPGSAEVGGIEVYAFELGEALQRLGHEIVLFGGQPKPGRSHRATSLRLSLHPYIETKRIWKLGTRFRKLVQRLHFASSSWEAVVQSGCQIMLVFKPYDFINAARWKRALPKMRVVMNYQGKDFFATDRQWRKFIDWEYAASEDNAKLAKKRYGALPAVIPNGAQTDLFRPALSDDAQPGKLRVLSAGRLVGWKGLSTLMEAVMGTREAEWHIAGEGPERALLEADVSRLSLGDQVFFHGVLGQEELAGLMRRMDAFAQPSIDFDACPTAVLQALSSGLLVMMSDQVGLKTYFKQPEECWVVPARKSEPWREALVKAARMPAADRRALGQNARRAVVERFGWESIARRMEKAFQDLLKAH